METSVRPGKSEAGQANIQSTRGEPMAGRKPIAEGGKRTPWTLDNPEVRAEVDALLRAGIPPAKVSTMLGLEPQSVYAYNRRNGSFALAKAEGLRTALESLRHHDDWRAKARWLEMAHADIAVPAEQVRAEIVKLANQAGLEVTDAAEALREITALVASRSEQAAEPETDEAPGQD